MTDDTSMSDVFYQELTRIIEANMSSESFGVDELVRETGMSRTQVHRKLKSITGKTISQIIREIRLQRAHEMLEDQVGTASEIAYKVGFNSPAYFNKCFHDHFGYTPGSLRRPTGKLSGTSSQGKSGWFIRAPRNWLRVAAVCLALLAVVLVVFYLFKGNSIKESHLTPRLGDKSIAVMPFDNFSNDPEQDYFADGMTEEILNHLVKVEDIKVVSRTSVMKFKDTSKSAGEIARELGVATVLEGSVRKDGDQLRISVQLIEGATDTHIWSESYDRELDDVFSIQSEVASQIVSSLNAEINPSIRQRIGSIPTTALDAYDMYLKGNELYWASWPEFNIDRVYESIDYYERAIAIDNRFSLAYTGLGRSYWWLAHFPMSHSDKSYMWTKSKEYLDEAIRLDPYNGWAYSEMAVVMDNWLWDSTGARNHLDIAIKLMPNDVNAYIHSFNLEVRLGNCHKARQALEKLQSLDSSYGSSPNSSWYVFLMNCLRNYSGIASAADQAGLNNIIPNSSYRIFDAYLHENRLGDARRVLDYMRSNIATKSQYYIYKTVLSARESDSTMTRQMLDSLKIISQKETISNTQYALIYASCGDEKVMYEYLDKALELRESELHDHYYFSVFNAYREEARFKEIMSKMWAPL